VGTKAVGRMGSGAWGSERERKLEEGAGKGGRGILVGGEGNKARGLGWRGKGRKLEHGVGRLCRSGNQGGGLNASIIRLWGRGFLRNRILRNRGKGAP